MTTELPIEAERYLANLAEGLRAMPRNERDSLLLELRSHFTGLAERRGPQAAVEGITELGSAQGLAQEFIAARRPGGAPVATPASSYLPDRDVRPFTVRAAIRETFATLRGADERLRIVGAVLLATLVATNFMAFLASYNPEAAIPKPATMAVRLVGLMFALVAGYRIMLAGSAKPWRVDLPFGRYILAGIAMFAALMAVQFSIKAAILGIAAGVGMTPDRIYPVRVAIAGIVTLIFVFSFIRFQPWMVALATGRPGLTPLSSWQGMRGKTAALIGGWLAVVLPFFVLHYGITAFTLSLASHRFYLPLAALDGIVAMIQALLTSALLVTAYRWVVDQAAPEPAPFASLEPSREAVAAARRALLDAIDARYERQMHPFRAHA